MYGSLLAFVGVPAIVFAQTTAIVLAQTTTIASSPTSATPTSCASTDDYCYATGEGWNAAAASYLATATLDPAFSSRVDFERSTAVENPSISAALVSYLSANANATGAAVGSVLAVEYSYVLPASDLEPFTSMIAVAQSLNGSLPQATPTQQTVSSHAAAAAVAKPTDMTFMAMAGAIAGVAGLAYGL